MDFILRIEGSQMVLSRELTRASYFLMRMGDLLGGLIAVWTRVISMGQKEEDQVERFKREN